MSGNRVLGGRLSRVSGVLLLAASVGHGCSNERTPGRTTRTSAASQPVVRIGVYDSRAIAVAWVRSKYNTRLDELTAEYKQAKAAGDQVRMKELKRRGSAMQDQLHRQGFGRAPVDDLLEPIRPRIPRLLASAGVERLMSVWDKDAPRKGTVDVTDLLVREYEPTDGTLRTIRELRKRKPVEPLFGHYD